MTWDTLTEQEQQWLTEAVEMGRQACYDTFEDSQKAAYQTFENDKLTISTIDHDEALAACAPVIAKYCETETFKAVYQYVQDVRKELNMISYWGMEDYMNLFQ